MHRKSPIGFRLAYIYVWPWPILKVKVKVMHISIAKISQTVIDRTNIAIVNALEVAYWHSIGIFAFGSKGRHSQFDCEKFDKPESCCILPYLSIYVVPFSFIIFDYSQNLKLNCKITANVTTFSHLLNLLLTTLNWQCTFNNELVCQNTCGSVIWQVCMKMTRNKTSIHNCHIFEVQLHIK